MDDDDDDGMYALDDDDQQNCDDVAADDSSNDDEDIISVAAEAVENRSRESRGWINETEYRVLTEEDMAQQRDKTVQEANTVMMVSALKQRGTFHSPFFPFQFVILLKVDPGIVRILLKTVKWDTYDLLQKWVNDGGEQVILKTKKQEISH